MVGAGDGGCCPPDAPRGFAARARCSPPREERTPEPEAGEWGRPDTRQFGISLIAKGRAEGPGAAIPAEEAGRLAWRAGRGPEASGAPLESVRWACRAGAAADAGEEPSGGQKRRADSADDTWDTDSASWFDGTICCSCGYEFKDNEPANLCATQGCGHSVCNWCLEDGRCGHSDNTAHRAIPEL